MAKFNGTELTPEAMQKTREHFAANKRLCAASCVEFGSMPKEDLPEGFFFVNGADSYKRQCREGAEKMLRGEGDHTLTFLQYAYYVQTGESIAILP